MENRVVCYYCGTIYDAEDEKCPLCGGKTLAKDEELHPPVQRRRFTDQERKQRRNVSKGGKFAASGQNKKPAAERKDSARTMLVAALVFLILAVVVLTWFIGDMIGWWGGLEDNVQRQTKEIAIQTNETDASVQLSDTHIRLAVGMTHELKLSVAENYNYEVGISWPDARIAKVVRKNESSVAEDGRKTDIWEVTAVSEGTATMAFTCGETVIQCSIEVFDAVKISSSNVMLGVGETFELQLAVATDDTDIVYSDTVQDGAIMVTEPDAAIAEAVRLGDTSVTDGAYRVDTWLITAVAEGSTSLAFTCGETVVRCEITVNDNYEPVLNVTENISLYTRGESIPLYVTNLPEGATVTWSSSDETVAKVDENGVVTAVGNGTAQITAYVLDKTAQIVVQCPFDESGDIEAHLKYEDVTLRVGESFRLYLLDSNDERITDVTYRFSKEGICSVENGKITALRSGTVTVTVLYNAQEYKCVVRVRG